VESFAARIFGPGLHAAGVNGTIAVGSRDLEIAVESQRQFPQLRDLQLREAGFENPGVELSWAHEGERWAAQILDAAQAQKLLAHPALAGTAQAVALRGKRRRHRGGRMIGWTAIAGIVLLPVLALLVFFLNADRLARWVADRIPIEQEIALGDRAFASMRAQLKLKDSGVAHDAVRTIGAKLTQGSRYQYRFHVVEDGTLNAFAMPGGIIVVHSGLIAATESPEQLAGVLAHEVQHVELRHSVQGMVKNLGLQAVWLLATGDLGSTLAGQAALQLTSLKFSRDAEQQADERGFDSLVAAGIDPTGMPEFFKTLREKAGDAPAGFLSSHPLSEDRQALLQERLAKLTAKQFAPLDFRPWPPG
jgi:beta-barrel assembly-enhancing protease